MQITFDRLSIPYVQLSRHDLYPSSNTPGREIRSTAIPFGSPELASGGNREAQIAQDQVRPDTGIPGGQPRRDTESDCPLGVRKKSRSDEVPARAGESPGDQRYRAGSDGQPERRRLTARCSSFPRPSKGALLRLDS